MRRLVAAGLASALLLGLVSATQALGRSPSVAIIIGTGKQQSGREKRIKARVAPVGPLLAGQTSTLLVSRMPKHAFLFVDVGPIQSTPACEHILCVPTFVVPDISSDRPHTVRTNGRGRALITFTMPVNFEGYPEEPGGRIPKKVQQFPWRNGQAVSIVAAGAHINHRGDQITGVAAAKTTVQVPPPPSPSP